MKAQIMGRRNPPHKAETYIMINGRFFITCKAKTPTNHKEIIETIKKELESGTLKIEKKSSRRSHGDVGAQLVRAAQCTRGGSDK
eukprot:3253536-Pyramimonas_sp.AAC.1